MHRAPANCRNDCVQVGDIAFATNRFEPFMDLMHRIQAMCPFMRASVVQLAGEAGAQDISTVRATKNKGYSATLFDNEVSSDGGQLLVEGTLDALEELRSRNIQTKKHKEAEE